MEFTREIYWNIGHQALTLVPMYLLAIGAVALMVRGMLKRVIVYRQGLPLDRTDHLGKRIRYMIKNVFLQKKVVGVAWPGLLHALFFWGFFLLFIGTSIIIVQADFTDLFFEIKFLKGTFYKVFSIVLDLAGFTCILMLAGLLVRRYFFAPEGLVTKKDDAIMFSLLLVILVTGFIIEGSRMAVIELGTPLAYWSPVGMLVANILSELSENGLRLLHKFTWWLHLSLVVGFLISIPLTKFRHLLTTSTNYLFTDLGPKGKLRSLDLENEDAETFGVTKLGEMTWKDIYDADACTVCKRCQDRCPAWNTGKPLSPMKVINQIQDTAFTDPGADLIDVVTKDVLWSCTTCRACQEICPADIEHVIKIVDMRRNLALERAVFPSELKPFFKNIEENGNPWLKPWVQRANWAEGIRVKKLSQDENIDTVYWVGCLASYDERIQRIAIGLSKLFNGVGLNFGIMGMEERCCGDAVRRTGNEYLFQKLARHNIDVLKKYNIKRVITHCPHCYNVLKNEYPKFGGNFEVLHHTEIIADLIEKDTLKMPEGALNKTVTFHDPCYLGRYNDIYDQPRKILQSIPELSLAEKSSSRENTFCCGGGGGQMWMRESGDCRVSEVLLEQVTEVKPEILATACPFCLTMLENEVREKGLEESLKVMDIVEIFQTNK